MTVSIQSTGMFWLAVELGYLLLIHSCEFSVINCNHFYFYVEIIDPYLLINCLIFLVISVLFVLNMRLSISKEERVQTCVFMFTFLLSPCPMCVVVISYHIISFINLP
jgi:hypothetical protein